MLAKKITGLVIVLFLMAGMSGISTWAFFADVETSSNNVLAAGTLDLKTDDMDGVSQTLLATNLKPGDTVGPQTIILKNSGSLASSSIDFLFSYTENDASPNPQDMSADDTASFIIVTALNYNGTNLLSDVVDNNANGWKDVNDLYTSNLTGYGGITPEATKNFQIAVQLSENVTGGYQSDGIDITMSFILKQ